jgi:hypothetical protein
MLHSKQAVFISLRIKLKINVDGINKVGEVNYLAKF